MTRDEKLDGAATLILRLGLVWLIFLWAAHKIITPGQYQGLARHHDGVDMSLALIYGVAGVQILICVLALVGVLRLFSYGGLLVMHFFTVSRRWEGFVDPSRLTTGAFPSTAIRSLIWRCWAR